MQPFILRTERFVLDQPAASDIDDITAYCADPVFEHYMTTPWPYERRHAEYFVDEYAPGGWERDDEWTWAIREREGGPLLGVVGIRLPTGNIGYWLGAPFRGRGIMPGAVTAAIEAMFERTDSKLARWECVVGNTASMRVAQKVGFRYAGAEPGMILARDGSSADSWHGVLRRTDTRDPKPGWPVAV